jgi:hypothetical protein
MQSAKFFLSPAAPITTMAACALMASGQIQLRAMGGWRKIAAVFSVETAVAT